VIIGSWSGNNILSVVLIALCIIGIILAVLLMVLGKKFKKIKRSTTAGSTTATKSVVPTAISPRTRYEPV
jgi:mannose/fructose/N-acetylgalactosamine-specific phosphotransferase system component IIC